MKDPMNSRDVFSKNVPGVEVGHAGVGWGGVGHAEVRWGGSCMGWVG